ncbi:MAG: hypothetical protein MRY83_14525 [Flavobacteriales bacterium]|nr:hypothetical protein [Flavobacteriales bacterium]
MKNLTLNFAALIAFMLFSQLSNAQSPCATPQKINGVAVYVMSEPTEDYDVVGNVNTMGAQTLMALASDNSTDALNIKDLTTNLVNRALRKLRKGKLQQFDAIITTTGDSGTCIKFKQEN